MTTTYQQQLNDYFAADEDVDVKFLLGGVEYASTETVCTEALTLVKALDAGELSKSHHRNERYAAKKTQAA